MKRQTDRKRRVAGRPKTTAASKRVYIQVPEVLSERLKEDFPMLSIPMAVHCILVQASQSSELVQIVRQGGKLRGTVDKRK